MSDQSLNIFSLETAKSLLAGKVDLQVLKPAEISFISKAHNLFLNYFSAIHPSATIDPLYEDFNYFVEHRDLGEIQAIINFLSRPQEGEKQEQTREVKKEDISIPVELEAMVAMYKQHQADLVDNERPNSLAENIKRAQKTINERRKYDLIYENASKERQKELDRQKEISDRLYSQIVNPKKSRSELTQNTRNLASFLVLSQSENKLNQSQYDEAVKQIVNIAETGGLDVTDEKSLYDISYSIVNSFTNENKELEELNVLVQKQLKAEALGLDTDEYNKKIDSLAEFVEDKENKKDKKDDKSNRDIFSEKLSVKKTNQDKSIPDPDVLIGESQKEINNITQKLSKRFPSAKNPYQETDFLAQNAKAIEKAILATDRTALSPIPVGLGARTSATLKETGSNALNPVVVDLYSRGLTPEKYKKLTEDKNSPFNQLLNKQPELRKRIENGIRVVSNSPDGKTIAEQLKPVSRLESYLPTSIQKALHPVKTIEAAVNKRIGEYGGKVLNKTFGKALGGKLEKYILKDGIQVGAKKLIDKAAVKVITAGAEKIGLKVVGTAATKTALAAAATALGISTAGLSLILTAAWFVVSEGFKKIKSVFQDTFGVTDKDIKDFAVGAGIGLVGMYYGARTGVKVFAVATKAAVISAAGIIWLSIATVAVFLTLTFLVAPILSTLVQFDSVEKVQYGTVAEDQTASCKGKELKNDKKKCNGKYCFPVGDTGTVSYLTYHHDYPANDIMRIGDKPGNSDDVPLPLLAYTSGYVLNATEDPVGGLSILIAGDDGRFYYYAHNMCNTIKSGNRVEAGTIIGGMDTSGNANGYLEHLHFHISTKPDMRTIPENYPNFIWPYEDFCNKVNICGSLNPEVYPELPYL